ncbi:uncharacterized protein [Diadema antillarum]|uniref:uncharacterized protein n=1 Tax=Diadema antillarum TaxID=105358 RepID=UPI003A85FCDF
MSTFGYSLTAVHCPDDVPSVPNGANVTILSNAYRGVAVYTCREGFLPTNSPTSVCLQNATWSSLEFTCEEMEPFTTVTSTMSPEEPTGGVITTKSETEPSATVISTMSPDEPTGGVITTKSEPGPSDPSIAAIASSVVVILVIAVAMALVIVLLMRR